MKHFLIFVFTYKARLLLAYLFIALNILQVLAGCAMTIASIYVCLAVTKNLYAEKAEIQFVFTVFAIFGTHIIVLYLVGIKVVELLFVKAHKRSTKRNLHFWLFLSCNTLVDLLIISMMIIRISKHIVRSIRHSMEKGMRHYLTDPVWKHTMDRWQFSLRCCGVNGVHDWYMISWLDKYHVNVDSETVQSLLLSRDHLHLPIAPWSCCDITYPMQCFHDPLQQIDSVHIWKEQPEVPEMSLYKVGCLEIIRYPIEMCLVLFLALCITMIFVQIAIIITSRYLYTSCRSAVVMHNCLGKAPGWLFTRDFLADRRGKTLSEIMLDLEHVSDSDNSEESTELIEEDVTEEDTQSLLEKHSAQKALASAPLTSTLRTPTQQSKMSSPPPPVAARRESLYQRSSISKCYKPLRSTAPQATKRSSGISSPSPVSTRRDIESPPVVPPRRESAQNYARPQAQPQLTPSAPRNESTRPTNAPYPTPAPPIFGNENMLDHEARFVDTRWSPRLEYLLEQDEDETAICSARNPVSSGAEDRLMLG